MTQEQSFYKDGMEITQKCYLDNDNAVVFGTKCVYRRLIPKSVNTLRGDPDFMKKVARTEEIRGHLNSLAQRFTTSYLNIRIVSHFGTPHGKNYGKVRIEAEYQGFYSLIHKNTIRLISRQITQVFKENRI
jgi:hypothetical protein